ncbi:N-acetyl-lysine deacetylase [Neomoorella glycerini]|uniref:N-acetyl-lysine deacetylase n=1 Tax=Neomoorella glycerini TaxID=55779 RepID=A0A6I5ZMX2_9FIRM|nr:YgeY family selenium metabolism-linked hydrolase [Moorella glycerini]QGP91232.1 N-acetyl-lysine deacetylase [Moorella glycerini]
MRGDLQAFVEGNRDALVTFLRKLIATPSLSGQEGEVAGVLATEMQRVGFDEVFSDSLGNLAGRVGQGRTVVLYDAHMDTVPAGDAAAWGFDPFQGKYENGIIYGRGASDDKGCLACMVYAGKAIKELNLAGDFTLYVVGVVGEEVGEGNGIKSFIEETGIKPDYVLIGEASGLRICRGHRGRALFEVAIPGKSGHASAPELADNALYKAAAFIRDVEKMGATFAEDPFLGKGTIAATKVDCKTPSLNTIPGECVVYLDRRLTAGEGKEEALEQVRRVATPYGGRVSIMEYAEPGYKGKIIGGEEFFPAWSLPEEHPLVQAGARAFREALGREPVIGRWGFSTDGTYTAGQASIPTIGFGPGDERYPHSEQDQIAVAEMLEAVAVYALLPGMLARSKQESPAGLSATPA